MTINIETTSNLNPELKQGHVWVTPIWQDREQTFKPRPIVIVGNEEANDALYLVINFITSYGQRDRFDVEIKHWAYAGLDQSSWVRTSKIQTILRRKINTALVERNGILQPRGYIGKLYDEDLVNVLEMCKHVF